MAITTAKALRRSIEDSNRHLSQLKLELGESSCLGELTSEIRKLRTARHVVISSEENTATMEMSEPTNWLSDDAVALLDAVAALRGVEEIQLVDLGITFGPQGPRFPACLLTRLLRRRGRGTLKRLVLSVRLWGDSADFQQLADCLALQSSLREVAWEEWCFPTSDLGNDEAAFDFDPIVAALANLPQLEFLSIKAMTAGSRRANLGTLSPSTMEALGRHSSLRELQLVHFQLTNKTVQALAGALSSPKINTSSQLQVLSLDLSKTGSIGAMKLFDSLATATSTITDLQIWASTHLSWAQDDCLEHLASRVLTVNTSLQSVSILTHSRTLQEAVQNLTVVNRRIAAAYIRMLETNCTLQHLILDDYGDNDNDSLSVSSNSSTNSTSHDSATMMGILRFYLALNASKRRQHLLQEYDTYTRRDWTDLLAMATVEPDRSIRLEALHYFLRLNPSLCQL